MKKWPTDEEYEYNRKREKDSELFNSLGSVSYVLVIILICALVSWWENG